ncbi:hydantoinase/carbamoylase family amidase [Acidisoma cellulosilyticum]|uniref:hydantoinase/carbamoylase family amidase n=1 Tax=Acidisoma cellulosilyticum TaxID=2802395 RepID=UPI001D0A888B|nr:hydantoinase/carbamoylase family amidase [Acidisoma cellulosilyticum]
MPNTELASRLFDALDRATRQGAGIVRDSYGQGEQAAHDILRAAASDLGLECAVDAIGNLMMTLPGQDRAASAIIIGSHLDSVPQGGNFDGAAGVVAGLCAFAQLRDMGVTPSCDVTVMAIRAEESAWFDVPYLGSAGAFGLLDPAVLAVRRTDTDLTLAETLTVNGFDVEAILDRRRLLDPARIRAYLEVHIEQGPELVGEDLPVAIVSGIRGCLRFRAARCVGEYAHSGAVPRRHRQDAVAATVALLHHMNEYWRRIEARGDDLVLTSGEFSTDPAMHGPSKIAGETRFVVDIRSTSDTVMTAVAAELQAAAARIEEEYRVRFMLGQPSYSPPALMDAGLRRELSRLSDAPYEMASGAGHDAAIFAGQGIPSAMIFIRNRNGSHNPAEAMALDDFAVAQRLLTRLLLSFPL